MRFSEKDFEITIAELFSDPAEFDMLYRITKAELELHIRDLVSNSFYLRTFYSAEDLMQDTFVELISKKNKFRNESQFKTYLFRIARNKAVDFIRKSSKTTFIFDETTVGDEDKLYVEDDICNAETKADLHAAIQTLNPAYREVIYLSYFNNLSNEEIAIIIKKSKRQTELLLYRAKQSLKSALEKEGFIYG